MEGGTTFHFVTDGIVSALEQAMKAAGGNDVMLWGGGNIAQQYLAAGLLDELELHVVPLLLGDGARIFGNLGAEVQLEQVRAVAFRMQRGGYREVQVDAVLDAVIEVMLAVA